MQKARPSWVGFRWGLLRVLSIVLPSFVSTPLGSVPSLRHSWRRIPWHHKLPSPSSAGQKKIPSCCLIAPRAPLPGVNYVGGRLPNCRRARSIEQLLRRDLPLRRTWSEQPYGEEEITLLEEEVLPAIAQCLARIDAIDSALSAAGEELYRQELLAAAQKRRVLLSGEVALI